MRRSALFLALLFCLSASLLHLTPALAQSTIHIPADQPTIQAGIDAANPGDTVLVAPGTYPENIDFKGKAITVTSSDGAAKTIIDGGARLATVQFLTNEGRSSTISNFTIRNGGNSPTTSGLGFGGVYVSGAAPTISGNIITGNQCNGVASRSGAPLILNNAIRSTSNGQNTSGSCALGDGSGVLLLGFYTNPDQNSPPISNTLVGNTIEENFHADNYDGGGILIFAGGSPVIENNIIRNNVTSGNGGGISMVNTNNFILVGNLIENNTASYGGSAIYLLVPGASVGPFTGILANNTFARNTLTSTSTSGGEPNGEIYLEGNLGQYAFVNNIVTTSSSTPALVCGTLYNYLSVTPLVIGNNDIYNDQGPAYGGACPDQTGGYGNLSVDPLLANPATGDFHLRQGSPAIDAGNTSILANLAANNITFTTDLDNNPRVQKTTETYPIIDMGAYEYAGQQDTGTSFILLTPSSFLMAGGSSITLNAKLISSIGTPTGVVTFYEDGNIIGSSTIDAGGNSTLPASALVPGVHALLATYPGQGFFTPAISVKIYVFVDKYPVTLTLTSTPNPSLLGQSVTFTASVSSADHTIPSPITLTDGSSTLATLMPDPNGVATYTSSSLTVGTHQISATYQGDSTHNTASSNLAQQVTSGYPTSTTISSLTNPAATGQSVTFVIAVSNPNSSAGGTPTGNVIIADGATVLATVPFTSGSNSGNAGADFSTSNLSVGSHTITATYIPTGSFAASSASVVEVITGQSTSTVLTALPNPASALSPVTLAVTVTSSGSAPSGSVTFFDGTTPIGTANLNSAGFDSSPIVFSAGQHPLHATYNGIGNVSGSTSNTVALSVSFLPTTTTVSLSPNPSTYGQPVTFISHVTSPNSPGTIPTGDVLFTFCRGATVRRTLDSSGTVSFMDPLPNTIAEPAGACSVKAVYLGDQNFQSSTSPVDPYIINSAPSSTTLTASPTSAYFAHPVTLQVQVTGLVSPSINPITGNPIGPANALPAGTVQFLDGGASIGTALLAAGSAVFTTASLGVGAHILTAVYPGDPNLGPSASAPVTVTILPQDFTAAIAPPALTIKTEHHASLQITITTIGALADTIHLSCGKLPEFASCTFSSNDLTTTSDPTVTRTSTLTIDTDALLDYARNQPAPHPFLSRHLTLALILPLGLFGSLASRRRLPRLLLIALFTAAFALTLNGCSGKYPGHTAPGTYTIPVIGQARTSGITHSAILTLTVTE